MNGLKSIPNWILWTAALLAAALVFRFAMRGYAYIGYTLAFIAALIVLHHYLPRGAWRAVTALVCVGLIYFCIVEIPIIANSRTDKDPDRKYLVVLGAAVHGSTPSLSMAHRLEGALDYLEAYPDSIAIVSGGQGNGEDISEAQAMFDWLTAHGVAPERVSSLPRKGDVQNAGRRRSGRRGRSGLPADNPELFHPRGVRRNAPVGAWKLRYPSPA